MAAQQSLRHAVARYWPLTRPDRPLLAGAALSMIAAAVADTVAVWLFSDIVDNLSRSGEFDGFAQPAMWWVTAAIIGAVTTCVGSYLTAQAAERFVLRLRDRTYRHMQRMGPDFFARHSAGDLLARLSDDVETIESLVSSGLVQLLVSVTSVLFFTAAVVIIRWDLAVVVAALMPLLLLATRRFAQKLAALARHERATNGAITALIEESIDSIELTQSHAAESLEATRMHHRGRHWLTVRLAQARLTALYTPLADLLETLAVITVLGVGAWEIAAHRLTIGGLVGFATYLGFLFVPIQKIGDLVVHIGSARASSDRISELLATAPAVTDRGDRVGAALPGHGGSGPVTTPARRGQLVVAGVSHTYTGANTPALPKVSFAAGPGQVVLLEGPSGAGKSTVARLLPRFCDPTTGHITLDGIDLRDYSLTALRRNVTLLGQRTIIVSGTVADNIAYGTPARSPEAIEAAARAAGADLFIHRLPDGYETPLSSGGPQLSGGQRQRIALARAFLRDTPVLVLDEPTTGLDARAVTDLLPVLRRLTLERTTLLITHDPVLQTLAHATVTLPRQPAMTR